MYLGTAPQHFLCCIDDCIGPTSCTHSECVFLATSNLPSNSLELYLTPPLFLDLSDSISGDMVFAHIYQKHSNSYLNYTPPVLAASVRRKSQSKTLPVHFFPHLVSSSIVFIMGIVPLIRAFHPTSLSADTFPATAVDATPIPTPPISS